MDKSAKEPIRTLAQRAANDPFFLAYWLRLWQEAEEKDEFSLAKFLTCAPVDLSRLGLCRQPGIAQYSISEDIAVLERRFGIDPAALTALLERGQRSLAPLLHQYAQAEGISWEDLAARLGCSPAALDAVAACPPPREEHFLEDVQEIAGKGVDFDRLLELLRLLQALSAFKERGAATQNSKKTENPFLLAARDRQDNA